MVKKEIINTLTDLIESKAEQLQLQINLINEEARGSHIKPHALQSDSTAEGSGARQTMSEEIRADLEELKNKVSRLDGLVTTVVTGNNEAESNIINSDSALQKEVVKVQSDLKENQKDIFINKGKIEALEIESANHKKSIEQGVTDLTELDCRISNLQTTLNLMRTDIEGSSETQDRQIDTESECRIESTSEGSGKSPGKVRELITQIRNFLKGSEGYNYYDDKTKLADDLRKIDQLTVELQGSTKETIEKVRQIYACELSDKLNQLKAWFENSINLIENYNTKMIETKGFGYGKIQAMYRDKENKNRLWINYTSIFQEHGYRLFENVKICGNQICVSRPGGAFLKKPKAISGLLISNCKPSTYSFKCSDSFEEIDCVEADLSECNMTLLSEKPEEVGEFQHFLDTYVSYDDETGDIITYDKQPERLMPRYQNLKQYKLGVFPLTRDEIDATFGNVTTTENKFLAAWKSFIKWSKENYGFLSLAFGSVWTSSFVGYLVYRGYQRKRRNILVKDLQYRLIKLQEETQADGKRLKTIIE